jgi:hypothetical protein
MRIILRATPESRRTFERLIQPLETLGTRLERPVERVGGDAIRRAFADNFATEGQGGWPALSEAWTVPERQAQGFAGRHPILKRTGSLMRSVTERGHPLHTSQVIPTGAGRFSVEIGSEDIRYNLLHFGGRTALGTVIPARPMAILWGHQAQGVERALVWAADQAAGLR